MTADEGPGSRRRLSHPGATTEQKKPTSPQTTATLNEGRSVMPPGPYHDNTLGSRVEPDRASTLPLLLCRAGTTVCALPLEHVIETMRPLPCVTIPGSPTVVTGVAIIRGHPVPVIDSHVLLGGRPSTPGRFVTLSLDNHQVALAVDQVLEVQAVDRSVVDGLPPLLADPDDGNHAISLLGVLDTRLLFVLDRVHLVPADVMVGLEQAESRTPTGDV